TSEEVIDMHRSREQIRAFQNNQGNKEVRPCHQEAPYGDHGNPWRSNRQEHAKERLEGRSAINPGSLFQLNGNRIEKVLHQPDTEWQGTGSKEKDDPLKRINQV